MRDTPKLTSHCLLQKNENRENILLYANIIYIYILLFQVIITHLQASGILFASFCSHLLKNSAINKTSQELASLMRFSMDLKHWLANQAI